MKRLLATLASTGLMATALGVGALAQPASAAGALNLSIHSVGTKKVDVSWTDASSIVTTPFDAYVVTLDNDADSTQDTADRSRVVDAHGTLDVRFEDLNSNTTYYATVYAITYTVLGPAIVPADGAAPGSALDTASGRYSPLTITASTAMTVTGKTVKVSGTLKDDSGAPLTGKTVKVLYDEYPQFGGATEKTVVTNSKTGRWSITSPSLTSNTWFWAEYRPLNGVGGWTGRILVEVRKKISTTVSPGLKVRAGTTVKFSGSVNADADFLGDAPVTACLQRLQGTAWGTLLCRPIGPKGDYTLSFKPGVNADGKYRVFSGMGPAYADSWSRTKKLVIT